jgi:RNA polymerase sigma-70 factor (ECF subfamily)
MYEEKSTEEIASQVGLSENATRQLIFRARAAFKKALIGDVDTTGMSAAAILSVAARKAASEGKKVGAAALTLIALVVMSLTVFPGLNRATTDQMAEAPAPSESNLNSSAPAVVPTPKAGSVDGSDSEKSMPNDQKLESVSLIPKPSSKAAEKALSELEPGGIFSSDSKTKAFVLDQRYTAVGDNGLTVKFTFNPTEKIAIKEVSAEISLENMSFGFLPTDGGVFTGLTDELLEIYVYSGKSPYVYDSRGKKWTETASTNAGFVIQVVMEKNRVDVRSITLGMNAANE